MTVLALIAAGVVASGGLLAAFTPDPAWISPINFAILIYIASFTRSEVRKSDARARELARIAKGSEDRATNAAAEITRLAIETAAHMRRMDDAVTEVVVLGRKLTDGLAHLRGEWNRLDQAIQEKDGRE